MSYCGLNLKAHLIITEQQDTSYNVFIENYCIPSVYSYQRLRELSPAELSPSLRSQHCMQIFRVPFIGKTSEEVWRMLLNFPHSFQILLSLRKAKLFSFLMHKSLFEDIMCAKFLQLDVIWVVLRILPIILRSSSNFTFFKKLFLNEIISIPNILYISFSFSLLHAIIYWSLAK